MTAGGPITGYGVLEHSSGRAATTELVTALRSSFVIPYDNTGGFTVGAGLANAGPEPASLFATIWDDAWTLLKNETLLLPARGHASFSLPEKFQVTAQKRGVLEFRTTSEATIAGMALRFDPDGRFVAVPNLPDV